jgi:hypothetical protein
MKVAVKNLEPHANTKAYKSFKTKLRTDSGRIYLVEGMNFVVLKKEPDYLDFVFKGLEYEASKTRILVPGKTPSELTAEEPTPPFPVTQETPVEPTPEGTEEPPAA